MRNDKTRSKRVPTYGHCYCQFNVKCVKFFVVSWSVLNRSKFKVNNSGFNRVAFKGGLQLLIRGGDSYGVAMCIM